ncbi:hypothetical protein [Methylobacter tundripaludum]|uniref:Uncharacterized protein n=1 Tax=Methylobacter tundripaludum (strain ATCC BAA-1195 / DSM 17260 / SV96) TaxID=697282 RepID=G3IUR1_METTV|nr:hypothetical protein [Methylobacter tundripaludum]EGW21596.1 hypothetical protein Mettu_0364 [Methylobacter tundripaludum SV96]
MATMTDCTLNGAVVDIDAAIDMKDTADSTPDFRCNECNQPVRPHRSGGHVSAHFEHLERNPNCSQSHVAS